MGNHPRSEGICTAGSLLRLFLLIDKAFCRGSLCYLMLQAPLVVTVVVAHDPGEWFDECLVSLAHSNYPNLEFIVVDNASTHPLDERVESYLPAAKLVRIEKDEGFAKACNFAVREVTGATHLVFCHDDIALAPDAITEMMEVAYAENAGIVTPKIVVWDSPRQILQLGLDLDKTGAVAARVDVGDLDQAQYDQVEEVFVAPGGCFLIRQDLFEAMEGFDEKIRIFYEDVDLSWRAHLLGARVVTAPSAKVRHLLVASHTPHLPRRRRAGRFSSGRSGMVHSQRVYYARKNQLRVLLKDANPKQRKGLLFRFLVLSLVEAAFFLLTGRPKVAASVIAAITWNFRLRSDIKTRRRELASKSISSDLYQVNFISGSARLAAFFTSRRAIKRLEKSLHSKAQPEPKTETSHKPDLIQQESHRVYNRALSRVASAFVWVVAIAFLIGTRSLLFGHIPLLGSMAPIPSPGYLFSHYFSSSYPTVLFGHQPAPTSWLLLGVLDLLVLGDGTLGLHLIIFLSPWIGALGIYKFVAIRRGRDSAKIAAGLFLALPLFHQALLNSSLTTVEALAITPWVYFMLVRARSMMTNSRRQIRRAHLAAGLMLAIAGAISPSLWIVIVLSVLFLSLPLLISKGQSYLFGSLRTLGIVSLVSFLLNIPWSVGLILPGHPAASIFGDLTPADIGIAHILSFGDVGSNGSFLVSALFLFGVLTPFIAKGRRATEAAVLLMELCLVLLFGLLSSMGILGVTPIPLSLIEVVAGVILLDLVAIGIQATVLDLRAYSFGLRQPLTAALILSIVAGVVFVAPGVFSGTMGLAPRGYATSVSFLPQLSTDTNVLWLGSPTDLPVGSFRLATGLALTVLPSAGINQTSEMIPPRVEGLSTIESAVESAISGYEVKLGSILASNGVGYVVIPQGIGRGQYFLGSDLDLVLERQLDLKQLLVDPALVAYQVVPPVKQTTGIVGGSPFLALIDFFGIIGQLVALGLVLLALVRKRSFLLDANGEAMVKSILRHFGFYRPNVGVPGAGGNASPATPGTAEQTSSGPDQALHQGPEVLDNGLSELSSSTGDGDV